MLLVGLAHAVASLHDDECVVGTDSSSKPLTIILEYIHAFMAILT